MEMTYGHRIKGSTLKSHTLIATVQFPKFPRSIWTRNQCRNSKNLRRQQRFCQLANTTDAIHQMCVTDPDPDSENLDSDPEPSPAKVKWLVLGPLSALHKIS